MCTSAGGQCRGITCSNGPDVESQHDNGGGDESHAGRSV